MELDKERRLSVLRDNVSTRDTVIPTNLCTTECINFIRQGRFTHSRAPNKPYHNSSKKACFKCGATSRLVKDCPERVKYTKAAASKLRAMRGKRNAVHHVLDHLCKDLNSTTTYEDGPPDKHMDDADIFETMIARDFIPDVRNDSDNVAGIYSVCTTVPNLEATVDEFQLHCLDSGVQRTIIGKIQAEAYCTLVSTDALEKYITRDKIFLFGRHDHHSLGTLNVKLPVTDDIVIPIQAAVVSIYVPLLLGLDVLRAARAVLDFGSDTLWSPLHGWFITLTSKRRHHYLE